MKVAGKLIVVTGGGSGIGRELVLELLRRSARVVAIDISEAGLAETTRLAAASEALATYVVDIMDRPSIEQLALATKERFGAVDGLINCAGIIQPFVRFQDLDFGTMERVLGVNLDGTVFMMKAFLPLLLRRPEAHIVNVSSMGGFVPFPGQTMYGASKAAVKRMRSGNRVMTRHAVLPQVGEHGRAGAKTDTSVARRVGETGRALA